MCPLAYYEVTEKSWRSDAWIWLTLLLVAGFLVWRLVSSTAALGIALLGLAVLIVLGRKGKKRVGDAIEVNDTALIFTEAGEHSCITFKEIKKVKQSKLFYLLGEPAYIIETGTGTRRRLQPDDYENGQELRDLLNRHLNHPQ